MGLSRRSFVRGAAVIPFALWFEKHALAQTPRVRFEARSAQGQAMLNVYAQAVQRMKNNAQVPERNPRSWTFQWYTHFVRGDRTKAQELTRLYPTPSPLRNLANEMWNTCQAHGGQPGQQENWFLPWHRMYVFFFEQIIRNVTGNQNFTLPYWNYSVAGPTHGRIPPPFGTSTNPLFVSKRRAGVNAGNPIDQGQPGNPLGLGALAQCTYAPLGAQPGFNMNLDQTVHGSVHVLVGNNQNMGAIPWAAGDPIFWMHHCNIDRIWASWNAAGRRNPSDAAFLNKTFVFADGAGNRVVSRIGDFLDVARLGYRYDRLEPVPACPPTPSTQAAAPRTAVMRANIQLGRTATKTTLAPLSGPQATVPLGQRIERLPANRRLFLIVRNVVTDIQPDVLYHLWLELPANAPGAQAQEFYVGAIHFFDASHRHEGQGPDKFFSFDITDLARRLQRSGRLAQSAELTIAPAGTPAAEAKPVIGEVSVVEQ